MRIADKIRNRESWTPTESTIGMYLQEHSKEAAYMSLNELSEVLHASKSSIIRFCKKLGFRGHKELCMQLAKELDAFVLNDKQIDFSIPFEATDDRRTIAEKTYTLSIGALKETWNDIDVDLLAHIARIIHDRKHLYLYAGEDSYLLAKDFQMKLETIGIHAYLRSVPGMYIQQACLQESDSIALLIYYSEKTDELLKVAHVLQNKKIPMIALTGPEKGPVSKYCQEIISVSYYEPSPKIAGFGSFVSMQMILNIIYGCIFNMDYDKNINAINNIEENRKKIQG